MQNNKKEKIRSIFFRTSLMIAAFCIGGSIFIGLTLWGNKNKGPLDDLLNSTVLKISSVEKNLIEQGKESRSESLGWLSKYKGNKTMFKTMDTLLLGAYDDNTMETFEPIINLEDSLNIKLPIISIYAAWGSEKNEVFPALRFQAIQNLGSIPLITWEPWLDDFDPEKFHFVANKSNKNRGGMKAIAAGAFDEYIDKWASKAAQTQVPFFLRLGHEMNDPYRYPWGPQNNKPEDYIAAWRHIHDRFNKMGATNIIWVWSPHPAYNTYWNFYPGDQYVDWIGVTAINYGTVASWSQWWSFDDIFKKFYTSVEQIKKPVIVTEFGSLAVGGNRVKWFEQAFDSLPQKYPLLKALVFYHNKSDNTTTYKSLDWTFEDDKEVTRTIRYAIQKNKRPL